MQWSTRHKKAWKGFAVAVVVVVAAAAVVVVGDGGGGGDAVVASAVRIKRWWRSWRRLWQQQS